jgi:hypothetical protein
VDIFYHNLKQLYREHSYDPNHIWNSDETGRKLVGQAAEESLHIEMQIMSIVSSLTNVSGLVSSAASMPMVKRYQIFTSSRAKE